MVIIDIDTNVVEVTDNEDIICHEALAPSSTWGHRHRPDTIQRSVGVWIMPKIEIFDCGCKSCQAFERNVREAIAISDVGYDTVTSSERGAISRYAIPRWPALVMDGVVLTSGRILSTKNRLPT
jgi:hypothetical protein